MMVISDLTKSFGKGTSKVDVLKGIQLSVNSAESIALLGKSGSGKSTLLSLMAGLDHPDKGLITIDGQDITKMSEKDLTFFRAKFMGIVFQQFHLVSTLTAYENVLLPLELMGVANAADRARELLKEVGLSHRADHLPSELSGGESQRVAIARALASKPKILFADEPSGNLDEETGAMVMDLLFKLVKGSETTLILVTHDQDLARRCQRIIHLEHGSLV